MRKLLIIMALSAFFAGCNTMQGAGKDMQQAGEKVQDSAQRNK